MERHRAILAKVEAKIAELKQLRSCLLANPQPTACEVEGGASQDWETYDEDSWVMADNLAAVEANRLEQQDWWEKNGHRTLSVLCEFPDSFTEDGTVDQGTGGHALCYFLATWASLYQAAPEVAMQYNPTAWEVYEVLGGAKLDSEDLQDADEVARLLVLGGLFPPMLLHKYIQGKKRAEIHDIRPPEHDPASVVDVHVTFHSGHYTAGISNKFEEYDFVDCPWIERG